MYVPAAFQQTDTVELFEFIRTYGFATVITQQSRESQEANNTPGMTATHLPVLLEEGHGPFGRLVGHFAKANDQALDFGQEALVIFAGPHAYISPTWYAAPNTVPTWNYVAVHAYGVLKEVTDRQRLATILRSTVHKYESSRSNPWSFDAETDFHQKLMDGIIGFEIEISKLQGKWKLNQNHPAERRKRVVAALQSQADQNSQEIARLMTQVNR